jgi:hypothetical protein
METKRSLAVLWNHCLAVLEYAVRGTIVSFPSLGYDIMHSHRTTMRRTQQHLCATWYQNRLWLE